MMNYDIPTCAPEEPRMEKLDKLVCRSVDMSREACDLAARINSMLFGGVEQEQKIDEPKCLRDFVLSGLETQEMLLRILNEIRASLTE